jgi:hypothetical protein
MPNHDIELYQAKEMLDNFRREFSESQCSNFISREQIEQILRDENIIGINIYNGFLNNNFHLIVVGSKEPSSNEYQIQDDLNCIKNDWPGIPGMHVEPNDLNS